MKRWMLAWITLVIGVFGCTAMADTPTTILAFGDSITEGGKNFHSYRMVLVPELQKRKLEFEFIGPKKSEGSAHAGYSGKSTKALRAMSEKIYTQFPADIVLLHTGHNSSSANKPVPGIVEETRAIIENFHKTNPKVRVLLAQVIPAGKLPKYSHLPELNQELEKLTKQLLDEDIKVTLVNQAAGFDWEQDTIGDKVHPNAKGSKKMADKWLAALISLLEGQNSPQ